jgi:hypothetical protein
LEQPEASAYAHFDQSCPFLSRVALPPCRPPPPQVGMTAFLWLRLGNLCDAPNATLLQLSMDHPLRYDNSAASEDGDRDRDAPVTLSSTSSADTAYSIDFYFRVVHQTGISSGRGGGSKYAEPSLHHADAASVASGTTAAVEEVQRSYVQLCASYGESKSVLSKQQRSPGEADDDDPRQHDSSLGLDGKHAIVWD